MSKKPSIPPVVGVPENVARILSPMKEVVERMKGSRPGQEKLKTLPSGASLSDVIKRVNEIIERLS